MQLLFLFSVFLFVDDGDLKTNNEETFNKKWLVRLTLLVLYYLVHTYLIIGEETVGKISCIESDVVSNFPNMRMMFLVSSSGQSY